MTGGTPRPDLPKDSREAKARIVLENARRQVAKARPGSPLPSSDVLIQRVAAALQISQVDVLTAMRARKISYTHRGLTPGRVENFLRDALRYPTIRSQVSKLSAPVPHSGAPGPAVQARAHRAREAAVDAPVVTRSAPAPGNEQYPACRRLVAGIVEGPAASATVDIYLALGELTAYRSSVQSRAIAEIVAERFGIHADDHTGSRLNDRAASLWASNEGAAQLDHLSRLERRLRGVFYDGHRDRVTAWDSSNGSLLLYICDGAALRTAAAAALDTGDLVPPVMRRQVVAPTYEPDEPGDPALVLAVAAEQLGRQSAWALHPTAPLITTADDIEAPSSQARVSSPSPRTVAASTWVQPVTGDWDGLVLEQMESSYTRHRARPQSRSATTVREHMRRAPGTSKNEPPTIPVRSHPRRGTGSGEALPKVTRVSSRGEMWR